MQIIFYLSLALVLSTMLSGPLFKIKHKVPQLIQQYWHILYCFKCLSLWITLICTQSIFIAVITSAIAIILEKILLKYE